jgi:predicted phosphoribosyltransferase
MVKGEEPTVLAIPRGGVIVGEEIAKKIRMFFGCYNFKENYSTKFT